ncbi:hypothetical protein [Methylobacterium sp. 77]|uniref:hypothetical protein n=1 Tax=Methylobacterium sp. 77 TaxID=1101192 RepID=UPI000365D37C|nr:hypothetical protein [Methylobacterium sp. 77]
MISALIYVARPNDPDVVDHLADSLGALVEGVAAGLVGDAVIIAASHHAALDAVAEATGATFVTRPNGTRPWSAGAKAARREWVLCLDVGDVPGEGWIRAIDRFIGTAGPETILGRLRRPHAGLPSRLVARGESVIGVRSPRAGDLVRRDRLVASADFSPRLRPRRVNVRLDRA